MGVRCMLRLIINIESFLLLGDQDGIDALNPQDVEMSFAFGVGNSALAVRQAVLQFSLVRNSVVEVINGAESCPLVVSVVANIPVARLASVLALTVLLSISEVALVNSQRLGQSAYIDLAVPFPWNLFCWLKGPLYSYLPSAAIHFKTPSVLAPLA